MGGRIEEKGGGGGDKMYNNCWTDKYSNKDGTVVQTCTGVGTGEVCNLGVCFSHFLEELLLSPVSCFTL